MLSKGFMLPVEKRAAVIPDVCGTLGTEEDSVLKNVGLV